MTETKALEAAKRNLESAGGWEDANNREYQKRIDAARVYALVSIAESLEKLAKCVTTHGLDGRDALHIDDGRVQ